MNISRKIVIGGLFYTTALLSLCIKDVNCQTNLGGMGGTFHSPSFPGMYPNHAENIWNIEVDDGYRIVLYFTEFDIEFSYQCEYDMIRVLSDDQEIARHCGNKDSVLVTSDDLTVRSPSNRMRVMFISDYSNEERFIGFKAHYYAEDIDECATENGGCDHYCHNYLSGYYCSCRAEYILHTDQRTCRVECTGHVFNQLEGIIVSPDYPLYYPKSSECDWTIDVEDGYVITLHFDTFDIESHPEVNCPYDFIKVWNGDDYMGPFCGDVPPSDIVSVRNKMKIMFHSDYSGNNVGFKAVYSTIAQPCETLYPPVNGQMRGGNFTFKENIHFTCDTGYYLVGSQTRTCKDDGSWTGVKPQCKVVNCGPPPDVSHGRFEVMGDGFTYTSVVVYYCDEFYELVGPSIRECGPNALWDSENPFCKPICGEASFAPRDRPRGRLLGGHEANEGSWPWVAFLDIDAPLHDIHGGICSGSLINEEWIITAAHCVTNKGTNRNTFGQLIESTSVRVRLGLHRQSEPSEHVMERRVSEIIRHSSYNPVTFDNDIALLHVSEPVQFSEYVRPVCLPPTDLITTSEFGMEFEDEIPRPPPDEMAIILGWGLTSNGGSRADSLLEAYVPIVEQEICRDVYAPNGWDITASMLCAGYEEGGRDACRGDSGGPLLFEDPNTLQYFVYGLVSWGRPGECASPDSYGVYARVSGHLYWIKDETAIHR